MAQKAQYERGAVKTAKQLGIRALPPDMRFECDVDEVFRWNNALAELQPTVEAVWRSQEIIRGRRYVLPAESGRGLYIEMQSQPPAAA